MCEDIKIGEMIISKSTATAHKIRFKTALTARKKGEVLSEPEKNTLKAYFQAQDADDVTNEEIIKAIKEIEEKLQ